MLLIELFSEAEEAARGTCAAALRAFCRAEAWDGIAALLGKQGSELAREAGARSEDKP
jgi:hypothetical protein